MDYFYTPPPLIDSTSLTIEGDEYVHLSHVMRKAAGDSIRVVDGKGMVYDATIVETGKRSARCQITATHSRLNEPALDVTIGVALLKNASKFDFLVEKVTELGVNAIVPLLTDHTIPRHAKVERWQKLALAAMKQSQRCVLPVVHPSLSLTDFLAQYSRSSHRFIFHEKSSRSLAGIQTIPAGSTIALCIGPEGGFSAGEITAAVNQGFESVLLGTTRLRTETAAIAAVVRVLE
jgi:16S rRNA (uracil1498-N3)-methyltransferase